MSKKEQGLEEYIYEMLLDLYRLECSEAFRFPVDIHLCKCPDYYTIIKEPMDLCTLTTQYKDGAYTNMKQIKDEIDKIIKNCRTFNTDPNHAILRTCHKFEQCFNSRWNKLNEIRMQLGIPEDYMLNVQMNKLDQIEQRKNKKKEPALLKDDQIGRKPRQPKIDMPKIFNKPNTDFPNQIKFKISSSVYQDDEPFVDSTSIKNEPQNFENPTDTKISFKKEMLVPNNQSFKVQIPKQQIPEQDQQQKEIIKPIEPPKINEDIIKKVEQPMKSSLSVKIPSLSKINSQTTNLTIPNPQPPPPQIQQSPLQWQPPPPQVPNIIQNEIPKIQIPKKVETPKLINETPIIDKEPIPKINFQSLNSQQLENKTPIHSVPEVKFTLPKPYVPPKPQNTQSPKQLPNLQKQSDKPQGLIHTPKIQSKIETINGPSTPKVRKIVDSDDEAEKIPLIPIIKKTSEKKVELLQEVVSQQLTSSEKKATQIPPFSLNESDIKPYPKDPIRLPQTQVPQSVHRVEPPPPPKIEPPPPLKVESPKHTVRLDLTQIFKGEQDYQTKKIEKLKKFAQSIMGNLKQYVIKRKPEIEILSKWAEIPSKTSLKMIHMWLKNDFEKITFQEFQKISKYIELANRSISKLNCEEDQQAEIKLQQCFDKEKEDEKLRLKKLEQELKEQQQPIILEKIDIEQLCKTIRVRQKKKNDVEKDKEKAEKIKELEKEKLMQKAHQQMEFQAFSLEPIKKVKLNQQIIMNLSEDEDEASQTNWWSILETKQKNKSSQMEIEVQNQGKNFSFRSLNQIVINKNLLLGEENNNGCYPKIFVEKMQFYLMNPQSTYHQENKAILHQFVTVLKENCKDKKFQIYTEISKSNYFIDERHTELFEIYQIDNYVEVIVKLLLIDDESFDALLLSQKININVQIQNILSYLSKENFINYSKINQQFQLKLAQYDKEISKPILMSQLYETNEYFVDLLDSIHMKNEQGCGVKMCNFIKQTRNQKFEYSCQIQLLIPFTCIQDLQVNVNETCLFNGSTVQ